MAVSREEHALKETNGDDTQQIETSSSKQPLVSESGAL